VTPDGAREDSAASADARSDSSTADAESGADAQTTESGGADAGDAGADASIGATPVQPLLASAAFYPRAVRLQGGHIVVSVVAPQTSGRLGATLLRSSDDGATLSVVGHVDDPAFAAGLCCNTLYELPRAVGANPQGTLLWAASVGGDTPSAPMSIAVWASDDEGASWSKLADAYVASVPRSGGGLWEPEFALLEDGTLVCHFSDETAPGHSQRLAAVRSSDGVSWGAPVATVALNDPAARPGMANLRRGPGGTYFMSYELCGVAADACAAHLRTSADGWGWGDPNDPGAIPRTVDGRELRHAPTLAWSPTPGPNGRFYLVGQMVYDAAGNVAPENGTVIFANTEGGFVSWYEIPAPVPVPSAYDNFCPNYSSSLLPLDDGAFALEVASKYDGTTCRSYFARGGLLGTGEATGAVAGTTVRLVNVESGLCLDVAGTSATGGAVQQWPCSGQATQRWHIASTAGGVRLSAASTGSCLAVAGGPSSAGAAVQQAPCDGSAAQAWTANDVGVSYYVLQHGAGMCLDDTGGSLDAGVSMEQWTCNQLSPQIWHCEAN
jgi:hypothetical protein